MLDQATAGQPGLIRGPRGPAGEAEGLTRDDILDNITLYWLTNTGVSSARLYWENKRAFFERQGRHRSRSP